MLPAVQAWIWSSYRRIVAVEAMIFGGIGAARRAGRCRARRSPARTGRPSSQRPEIRCSSSWMIRPGGDTLAFAVVAEPEQGAASGRQAIMANLSTVPITIDGRSRRCPRRRRGPAARCGREAALRVEAAEARPSAADLLVADDVLAASAPSAWCPSACRTTGSAGAGTCSGSCGFRAQLAEDVDGLLPAVRGRVIRRARCRCRTASSPRSSACRDRMSSSTQIERGGAQELLGCQQPERVAHQGVGACVVRVAQAGGPAG